MTNEDLQKIISAFDEQNLKTNATFGIFAMDEHWEVMAIKANKEGLQLFALELLIASQKTNKEFFQNDNNTIPLDISSEWISQDSDIRIHYVEQVDKTHEAHKVDDKKETFADKSMKYGCFAILILLVIAMFVGLWTLGKWLFKF